MAGWTAGTPTTENTMHISRIEIYLSFAKVGAKLIEMRNIKNEIAYKAAMAGTEELLPGHAEKYEE